MCKDGDKKTQGEMCDNLNNSTPPIDVPEADILEV